MLNFDMEKFLDEEFDCKRSGTNMVFDCPFCKDKKNNYWFDIAKEYVHHKTKRKFVGLGHCWVCGETHSVLTFIMEYKKYDLFKALNFIQGDRNVTYKDLLQLLKESKEPRDLLSDLSEDYSGTLSVDLPEGSSDKLPKELVKWFEKTRSYPKELLKWLGVKYCWKAHTDQNLIYLRNRAIFPVVTGKSHAWQAYLYKPGISNKTGQPFAKTRNPPGPIMKSLLYFYEHAKTNKLIIGHEGIFDVLRSFTRNFSPVGLLGKNLSYTQAYLISQTKAHEFCMGLDGGEKEELQAVKNSYRMYQLYEGDITIMRLDHGVDPDDISEKSFIRCFKNRKQFDVRRIIFDGKSKISGYNW